MSQSCSLYVLVTCQGQNFLLLPIMEKHFYFTPLLSFLHVSSSQLLTQTDISFYPLSSSSLPMCPCLSLCSYHVERKACCFTLQWRSPLPPPDHCQWESPSNPCCCLAWHRLTLPLHICMSCGVSAKVYSDVMGPDGSIFPADSDDCHAQV